MQYISQFPFHVVLQDIFVLCEFTNIPKSSKENKPNRNIKNLFKEITQKIVLELEAQ